jgi:hypothetical protein
MLQKWPEKKKDEKKNIGNHLFFKKGNLRSNMPLIYRK